MGVSGRGRDKGGYDVYFAMQIRVEALLSVNFVNRMYGLDVLVNGSLFDTSTAGNSRPDLSGVHHGET